MTRAFATALILAAIALPALTEAAPFYSVSTEAHPTVREALEICTSTDGRPEAEIRTSTTRGIALAEKAIAENDRDARAHFALFCNLGRRAELDGVSMDALSTIERVEAAVDRALELEPHYLDAMIGKGRLLIELPWMLGGDEDRGEELLRLAVELDPAFSPARDHLASFLEDEGRLDEMPEPLLTQVAMATGR